MKNTIHIEKRLYSAIKFRVRLIAIIVIVLFLSILKVKAQTLVGSAYMEQTIFGVQKGFSIGAQHHRNFGVAYFFQSTQLLSNEVSVLNHEFQGLEVNAMMPKCGKVAIGGLLQAGFANRQYFIATPKLLTSITWNRFIETGFTMGYRAGQAAIGARIFLKLPH